MSLAVESASDANFLSLASLSSRGALQPNITNYRDAVTEVQNRLGGRYDYFVARKQIDAIHAVKDLISTKENGGGAHGADSLVQLAGDAESDEAAAESARLRQRILEKFAETEELAHSERLQEKLNPPQMSQTVPVRVRGAKKAAARSSQPEPRPTNRKPAAKRQAQAVPAPVRAAAAADPRSAEELRRTLAARPGQPAPPVPAVIAAPRPAATRTATVPGRRGAPAATQPAPAPAPFLAAAAPRRAGDDASRVVPHSPTRFTIRPPTLAFNSTPAPMHPEAGRLHHATADTTGVRPSVAGRAHPSHRPENASHPPPPVESFPEAPAAGDNGRRRRRRTPQSGSPYSPETATTSTPAARLSALERAADSGVSADSLDEVSAIIPATPAVATQTAAERATDSTQTRARGVAFGTQTTPRPLGKGTQTSFAWEEPEEESLPPTPPPTEREPAPARGARRAQPAARDQPVSTGSAARKPAAGAASTSQPSPPLAAAGVLPEASPSEEPRPTTHDFASVQDIGSTGGHVSSSMTTLVGPLPVPARGVPVDPTPVTLTGQQKSRAVMPPWMAAPDASAPPMLVQHAYEGLVHTTTRPPIQAGPAPQSDEDRFVNMLSDLLLAQIISGKPIDLPAITGALSAEPPAAAAPQPAATPAPKAKSPPAAPATVSPARSAPPEEEILNEDAASFFDQLDEPAPAPVNVAPAVQPQPTVPVAAAPAARTEPSPTPAAPAPQTIVVHPPNIVMPPLFSDASLHQFSESLTTLSNALGAALSSVAQATAAATSSNATLLNTALAQMMAHMNQPQPAPITYLPPRQGAAVDTATQMSFLEEYIEESEGEAEEEGEDEPVVLPDMDANLHTVPAARVPPTPAPAAPATTAPVVAPAGPAPAATTTVEMEDNVSEYSYYSFYTDNGRRITPPKQASTTSKAPAPKPSSSVRVKGKTLQKAGRAPHSTVRSGGRKVPRRRSHSRSPSTLDLTTSSTTTATSVSHSAGEVNNSLLSEGEMFPSGLPVIVLHRDSQRHVRPTRYYRGDSDSEEPRPRHSRKRARATVSTTTPPARSPAVPTRTPAPASTTAAGAENDTSPGAVASPGELASAGEVSSRGASPGQIGGSPSGHVSGAAPVTPAPYASAYAGGESPSSAGSSPSAGEVAVVASPAPRPSAPVTVAAPPAAVIQSPTAVSSSPKSAPVAAASVLSSITPLSSPLTAPAAPSPMLSSAAAPASPPAGPARTVSALPRVADPLANLRISHDSLARSSLDSNGSLRSPLVPVTRSEGPGFGKVAPAQPEVSGLASSLGSIGARSPAVGASVKEDSPKHRDESPNVGHGVADQVEEMDELESLHAHDVREPSEHSLDLSDGEAPATIPLSGLGAGIRNMPLHGGGFHAGGAPDEDEIDEEQFVEDDGEDVHGGAYGNDFEAASEHDSHHYDDRSEHRHDQAPQGYHDEAGGDRVSSFGGSAHGSEDEREFGGRPAYKPPAARRTPPDEVAEDVVEEVMDYNSADEF